MAQSEGIAGVDSYVIYKVESTYNTAVTPDAVFGLITNFRSTVKNNMKAHRGFTGTSEGGRNIVKFTAGKLDVGCDVDFKVQDWSFMEYVMGSISGSDPYDYDETSKLPSITISNNIDNPGSSSTDQCETFSGSLINSAVIRTSVGEPVTCSLEIKSALETIGTSLDSNVSLSTNDVFSFIGGSIEIPDGSQLDNIIDSIEITITNNVEILYGTGSRLGQNGIVHGRDYSIKTTLKYLDNDLITKALGAVTPTDTGGPTENATVVLNFASGEKSLEMTFSGVPMEEFAQASEINNPITDDITLTAKSVSFSDDRDE